MDIEVHAAGACDSILPERFATGQQTVPTAGAELAEFPPAPSWGFLGAAHGWEPHSGLLFSARKDKIKPTLQHHRCPLGHL